MEEEKTIKAFFLIFKMDLFTKFYVPSLKKEMMVNKITFEDILRFNLCLENSNYIEANTVLNIICKKAFNYTYNLTNLDKFALLLHLKINFLNPILTLVAKNENSEKISYEIFLENILQTCKEHDNGNISLPSDLYYSDANEIIKETNQSIDEIKKHLIEKKNLMFEIPNFIYGLPNIYINCFDNTLFYFCKLLYSFNLNDLYKKIKILKKDFNFLLSEIYDMSPKEVDIFLNTK